jgi:type IV pilus assembly protein PilC
MNYEYIARDPLGKSHEGSIEAASREEAAQLLRRDGFQVVQLEEANEGFSLLPKRIKKAEIIAVVNQLAVMVDTGVTLDDALNGMCEQEQNPCLKRLLEELKSDIESGEDFSKALARHPRYFDQSFVAMIKASEQTGTMGEMLEQAAHIMQYEMETRRKVRAALAYPGVMLVIATGITILLLTYVLPKFAPLFNRKNIDLPGATVFLMDFSDALIGYWWAWIAGAVLLIVGFFVWRRTRQGRVALDWFKINSPIIGPMLRKVAISRSIRVLGTMLHGGVPLLDALAISAEVSGNHFFRETWQNAADEITQGSRIRDALAGSAMFPATLLQMIGCGEETGTLDAVLHKVSRHYDTEVDSALKVATRLLEPLMITVLGGVVGGIAYSLLLPVFQLSTAGAG